MSREGKIGWLLLALFLACYHLPVGHPRFDRAVLESLELVRWYTREHVLLCLLPAFWIAGAIGAFLSQAAVLRHLGPRAPKPLAYGVAAVSGTVLAVCSCTVLPLFAGIHRMGAGLGPATTFLYSGPAINVLAVILTAKVLGLRLGLARILGAVAFSLVIGLLMAFLFRREEQAQADRLAHLPDPPKGRPLGQTAALFAVMVGILVFANWGGAEGSTGFFAAVHGVRWWITGFLAAGLGGLLVRWYGLAAPKVLAVAGAVALTGVLADGSPAWPFLTGSVGLACLTAGREDEAGEWFNQTWSYTKQILPLLLGGVLVAGLLLGRPGREGLVPADWIASSLGGNGLGPNAFSAVAGALMYFATLTEIPILQGLRGHGMGEGPALALLLAGPALSLPSMLVINSVLGPRRTLAYVSLVMLMATFTGWLFGLLPA